MRQAQIFILNQLTIKKTSPLSPKSMLNQYAKLLEGPQVTHDTRINIDLGAGEAEFW